MMYEDMARIRMMPEFKNCRSIESMEKVVDEIRSVQLACMETIGDRKYLYYIDGKGDIWYKTMIRKGRRWEDEEIAIFGRKIKKAGSV